LLKVKDVKGLPAASRLKMLKANLAWNKFIPSRNNPEWGFSINTKIFYCAPPELDLHFIPTILLIYSSSGGMTTTPELG
jgi:hypothetical protein